MNYTASATSAYRLASSGVSSLRAVVLLYDGMIQAVGMAKAAIAEQRIEDRFNATQKASKILLGLQSSLDFEKGGEISVILNQFYGRIFNDLQRINMTNAPELCDQVIASLGEVRQSWHQLALDEAKPASAAAAPSSLAKGGAATSSVAQGLALIA